MIYVFWKEALLLSFNNLSLFSQDNHSIRKSQRMTSLVFNDSGEPYVHNWSAQIQVHCPGAFLCIVFP